MGSAGRCSKASLASMALEPLAPWWQYCSCHLPIMLCWGAQLMGCRAIILALSRAAPRTGREGDQRPFWGPGHPSFLQQQEHNRSSERLGQGPSQGRGRG